MTEKVEKNPENKSKRRIFGNYLYIYYKLSRFKI